MKIYVALIVKLIILSQILPANYLQKYLGAKFNFKSARKPLVCLRKMFIIVVETFTILKKEL